MDGWMDRLLLKHLLHITQFHKDCQYSGVDYNSIEVRVQAMNVHKIAALLVIHIQPTTSVWAPIDSKRAESWTIFSIAAVDRTQYKKIKSWFTGVWREIHHMDTPDKVVHNIFTYSQINKICKKQPNLVSSVYWVDLSLFAGHQSRHWPISVSVKERILACHEANPHHCWTSLPKEPGGWSISYFSHLTQHVWALMWFEMMQSRRFAWSVYLRFNVAKMVRQGQHRQQYVNGSSSEFSGVYIGLKFGQFTARRRGKNRSLKTLTLMHAFIINYEQTLRLMKPRVLSWVYVSGHVFTILNQ